jgi:hypothetical protein
LVLAETSRGAPAIAHFQGRLYIAWCGTNPDENLNLMSSADGSKFDNKVTLGESSSMGPALAVWADRLYMAWRGKDDAHSLNVISSADGKNFDQKMTFPYGTLFSPSLIFGPGPTYGSANVQFSLWLLWTADDPQRHLYMMPVVSDPP